MLSLRLSWPRPRSESLQRRTVSKRSCSGESPRAGGANRRGMPGARHSATLPGGRVAGDTVTVTAMTRSGGVPTGPGCPPSGMRRQPPRLRSGGASDMHLSVRVTATGVALRVACLHILYWLARATARRTPPPSYEAVTVRA